MNDYDDIDARLAALGERTERLRPSHAFDSRVMQAIQAQHAPFRGWALGIAALSKTFVSVALVVAIASVGWAWQCQKSAEEIVAVSYDAVEVSW